MIDNWCLFVRKQRPGEMENTGWAIRIVSLDGVDIVTLSSNSFFSRLSLLRSRLASHRADLITRLCKCPNSTTNMPMFFRLLMWSSLLIDRCQSLILRVHLSIPVRFPREVRPKNSSKRSMTTRRKHAMRFSSISLLNNPILLVMRRDPWPTTPRRWRPSPIELLRRSTNWNSSVCSPLLIARNGSLPASWASWDF